jgi:hypothetical protein
LGLEEEVEFELWFRTSLTTLLREQPGMGSVEGDVSFSGSSHVDFTCSLNATPLPDPYASAVDIHCGMFLASLFVLLALLLQQQLTTSSARRAQFERLTFFRPIMTT